MAADPTPQSAVQGNDRLVIPPGLATELRALGKITLSSDPIVQAEPNYSIFRFLPRRQFDGTVESHDAIVERNTQVQQIDKLFGENLKFALGQPDEPARIQALLTFSEKPLIPRQIVQIAQELSFHGADKEMIQFLEAQKQASAVNNTQAFFDSPEVKQWEATAMQKVGLNADALRLSNEILAGDPKNSEALRTATMARVVAAGDNRTAVQAEFAHGFAETGNYSLGMGALNSALEAGDVARAKELAPLVALAAKNVGADQSKSFWPAVVHAQAAIIGGDVAESQRAMLHLVEVLGAKNENGTPVVSSADRQAALDRINHIVEVQPGAAKAGVTDLLKPVVERLEMSLGKRPEQPLTYAEPASVEKTFRERGYTSRAGMTPEGFHIRGNVRRGSMLSDSVTTSRDKMQFLEVAQTPLNKFIEGGLIRREDLPPGTDTTKSLSAIDDVETRIKASQQVARGIFDVDGRNLEDLHGLDHKIYDSVVRLRLDHSGATSIRHLSDEAQGAFLALKENEALYNAVDKGTVTPEQREVLAKLSPEFQSDPVGAAKKLITDAELFRTSDTRTNIAVAAEQGVGDCRHVAAATEALVSAVQQDRTSGYIRQAAESLAKGDQEGYQRLSALADRELGSYEMRIYDQGVKAAVEVAGTYNPVMTADGRFVAAADNKPQLIETHMHNVVRLTGADGQTKYAVADSFYQKGPYQMGWVENEVPESFYDEKKKTDRLRLSGGEVEAVVCERDEAGNLRMKDGHPIPVLDEAGKPVTVKRPLVLESTDYSSPSRIELGTPTPEDRLNGRSRDQGAPPLAEALQSQRRNADYVVQADFVVSHPDKVNAPELGNHPEDRAAARQRVAELKGSSSVAEQPHPAHKPPVVEHRAAAHKPAAAEHHATTHKPPAVEHHATPVKPPAVERPATPRKAPAVEPPHATGRPVTVERPAAGRNTFREVHGKVGGHADKGVGIAGIGLDIAKGNYGAALQATATQVALNPGTYKAAATLAHDIAPVAKALGFIGKKIPVIGAVVTVGFVAAEVGTSLYHGNYGKAGAALGAGAAEALGNLVGFGVGDAAREVVREGVVRTAGEKYAPDKSGLRQLGEEAVHLAQDKLGKHAAAHPAKPAHPPAHAAQHHAAPTIFGYKNLPAVAYVLKSTPSSALNGHLQRTPDGFIKNFRQLDMSDQKNLRAFESAIDRQILKARKTVAGGTSFISTFIHWDDMFRRSEYAKFE
ncbi:MAG: hypothetical protein ACAH83_08785 [Alphaproteobacteria bacterium]